MKVEIDSISFIPATADGIGRAFANMHADEQAAFFHRVADESKLFPNSRVFQWSYIAEHITPEAETMLGEWIEYFSTPGLAEARDAKRKREMSDEPNEPNTA
jgi:hypothetical protein